MTWVEGLLLAGVAGLLLRRLLEIAFLRGTLQRLAARLDAAKPAPSSAEFPKIVVLLPLYKEQPVVRQLFEHFRAMQYPPEKLRIVFITTAKEPENGESSTRECLARILKEQPTAPAGPTGNVVHIHYQQPHRFRCAQLNAAVESLGPSFAAEETYVGVYNADSLPDPATLEILARDACLEKRRTGRMPPAYQQPAVYFVPRRYGGARLTAHAAAAFQTIYTVAHFMRRTLAAELAWRDLKQNLPAIPVTFLGHGEFLRLDVLHDVELFPDFAYADGLLLGWMVAFRGHGVRALPAFDYCEVPATLRLLVKQHAAWFTGLLNLPEAVRAGVSRGYADMHGPRFLLFCFRRMAATIGWGCRTPLLVALLGMALFSYSVWLTPLTFAAVTAFAMIPVLCVFVWPQLSSDFPGNRRPPVVTAVAQTVARCCAAIPTLFADGVGFWLALLARMRMPAQQIVPPKTER